MQEFLNNLTEIFSKNLQEQEQKLLLRDIIAIYNGVYNDYSEYKEQMFNFNNWVDNENNNFLMRSSGIKWNFNYYIKHNILSEFEFNYIIELSKCYITGVGK